MSDVLADANRYTGSVGFGYRTEDWHFAGTYRRSVYQNDIYLFSPDLLDAGRMQKSRGQHANQTPVDVLRLIT